MKLLAKGPTFKLNDSTQCANGVLCCSNDNYFLIKYFMLLL